MDPLSGKPHFAPPVGPIKGERTVNPRRRLAPLIPPPSLNPLPEPLPKTLFRECAFTATHTLSVHILPAAFPRAASPPGRIVVPPLESFPGHAAKEDRKKWLAQVAQDIIAGKHEAEKVFPNPDFGIKASDVGIWGAVSRIRRNRSAGKGNRGITLVTMHPIGFHKETWEPLFKHLIEITETSESSIKIEEIWSLDVVNHGDAALINGPHIPKLSDRSDYARDIANFLTYHLPDGKHAFGKDLPFQLTRLSQDVADGRKEHGFGDRNVVSLGHSLGGDATAACALSYPRLFSAIILLETTLYPPSRNASSSKLRPAIIISTLGRRSSWASRDEAKKALLKIPLFQAFDPAVLDAYIEHGMLKNDKTGEIRLKCDPVWEASEYGECRTMNEAWELLPTLDENVELRWIMGGREDASDLVGGFEKARLTLYRRPKNTTNVIIPGAGHLLVQEKPKDVAEDVALFLNHKFGDTKLALAVKL